MHAHANKKSFSLVRQRKRSQAEVKRELRLVDGKVYKLCVEDGKIILAPKNLFQTTSNTSGLRNGKLQNWKLKLKCKPNTLTILTQWKIT